MTKAGYFETSGSDYRVAKHKYRLLIRVEPVLNGISTQRKPGFSVEHLQYRGSSPRNVINTPSISGICVARKSN